jgi:hypothetical protein
VNMKAPHEVRAGWIEGARTLADAYAEQGSCNAHASLKDQQISPFYGLL